VAHPSNPTYLGGRDQDYSLKPAQANCSKDPISKKPSQKGLVEWFKVQALSLNLSTTKRKKKNK
jgi:hypothetical protein